MPDIEDPSDSLIEVHLAVLRWNMQSRKYGLTASGIGKLYKLSVELLETFKSNMPEKCGEANAWKFEKAHSILHKVRCRIF